jgi:hypothetical protein
MENGEKKKLKIGGWIKRIMKVCVLFIFLVSIWTLILTIRRSQQYNSSQNNMSAEIKINGNVLAESDTNIGGFKSDNYRVPQISFGGEGTIFYPAGEEQKGLQINDVKSEIYTDKNNKDKKLLVSWETNKQARCTLSYTKAGATSAQEYREANFGYDHAVLATPLDSGTTYNYIVTARDKWGNEMQSDKFAVYTGALNVSFLDLLAGAFKDVFGWAMKK